MKHFLHRRALSTLLASQNHDREQLDAEKLHSKDDQHILWSLEGLLGVFLLCWVTLASVQGFLLLAGSQPFRQFQGKLCFATFPQQGACFLTTIFVTFHDLPRPIILTLFTFSTVLQGIGLWVGLARKVRQPFFWLFFLLQGTLFLIVCLIAQQTYLALSLYLALLLVTLSMLKRIWPMLIILCFYSVLLLSFSYASFVSSQILYKQGLVQSIPSWDVTNYTAFILFVTGYLLLYMQQLYAHKRITAYATRVEELTRLTERQRLARELHDTLSQGLVGLSLQLDAADALLTRQRPERAQEVVRQAMERARSTLAETRSSLDTLRAEETPDLTGTILTEHLNEQIAHFIGSTGLACKVAIGNVAELPSTLYEPLLRMITEGLTNVARHAHAQQVEIRICQQNREVEIDVSDDGVGFDPLKIDRETGHYGLLGLHERTHSLGGQMRIESVIGKGTHLHFTIPLS